MLSDKLRGAGRKALKPGYYGVVEFGTLKNGATELALPTRPWRSDFGTDKYADGGGNGNIPAQAGTNLNNYTFADTSTTAANVLRWHLFVDTKRYLYIADRCLIANCSWDHINGSNYMTGRWVTIDGVDYWCRCLTGGTADRAGGSDGYYAGGKLDNEWDRYVMNGHGITGVTPPYFEGAPEPANGEWNVTASLAENNTIRKATHNQTWNWIAMYSWTNDVTLHDNTRRANRGHTSARLWAHGLSSSVYVSLGWRPCLEL